MHNGHNITVGIKNSQYFTQREEYLHCHKAVTVVAGKNRIAIDGHKL